MFGNSNYVDSYLGLSNGQGFLPESFKSPLFLSIDLTYHCTLKCLHCCNMSGEHGGCYPELSQKNLIDLTKFINEYDVMGVCLTGGDALLNTHFWEIAENISSIPFRVISTISNGWLIGPRTARRLSEAVTNITISIDGGRAETHDFIRGRTGSFTRAFDAINNLSGTGIPINVNFTAMKINYQELPILIKKVYNAGVISLEIDQILKIGRAYKHEGIDGLTLGENDKIKLFDIISEMTIKYPQLKITFRDSFANMLSLMKARLPNIFMHVCADGEVKAIPLLSLSFGNINNENIELIWKRMSNAWKSQPFQQYIKVINTSEDIDKQISIPYIDDVIPFEGL